MNLKEKFYPEVKIGGFTDVDGTIAFYSRVNSLLGKEFTVLDVGCGRGTYGTIPIQFKRALRILKGKVAKVIGIDVDGSASINPYLDEFQQINGVRWPVKSESIDLVVCDFVLEHVQDVPLFFDEMRRVMKQGGYLCIRTSNSWSYFALISRLIPSRYHAKILSIAQRERKAESVFPTEYRCNTVSKIKAYMSKYGFDAVVYGYEAEPAYLNFSQSLYLLGMLYQKFAPGVLKSTIFAFGIKR